MGIEPMLANTPMLWGMDLTIAHATNQYRKDLINEKKARQPHFKSDNKMRPNVAERNRTSLFTTTKRFVAV